MVSASEILALEERRRHTLLAGDLPVLRQLLADDLIYVLCIPPGPVTARTVI